MTTYTEIVRPLALLLLVPFLSLGQAPPSPLAAPPAGPPDPYYAYFTKGPQGLSDPGVSAADAVKVSSVSASAVTDLTAIVQHLQTYLAAAKLKGEQPKAAT